MYDHPLFVQTLSAFTHTLLTPYDTQTMLEELTDRVTAVLSLTGSGVALAVDGHLTLASALPNAVADLERLQEQLEAGPTWDAHRTGTAVTVTDLREQVPGWEGVPEAAERLGLRAVAAVPMRLGEWSVGALSLYAGEPREWPEEDVAAAAALADMATGYLVNASKLRQQEQLAEQLQTALDSRVVIEQAKGMVAAAEGITVDEAFARIRRYARDRNLVLRTVAQQVVSEGLRP
ncbi:MULTISPECIES: GAF and ANTAR domain-containing protein [unclassified Knoellia]|uniref:GAF and ANTAR domain-containing protein n=1 Tax=unclassified Knoellia TaxID=2618719 RepID=UPI0023DC912F|nr:MULTISPECIES: GAF and ANTAR domain-containing protein [unclassified Knoellia]MDF2092894.1 GAF and ANTAR domain-containing protein [Knoellia sp. 3-2P3]MDF2146202.1 GAF and ANTAR domain-containing protein [Knoellia sp. p5-6-4]